MLESRFSFFFWMHLAQAFSDYSVANQGAVPSALPKPMDLHHIYRTPQDTLARYEKHPSSHPEIYLKWPKKSGLTTDTAKTCWGVATSIHLHLILLALTPQKSISLREVWCCLAAALNRDALGWSEPRVSPGRSLTQREKKQLPPEEPDLRHSPSGGATFTSSEVLLQQ